MRYLLLLLYLVQINETKINKVQINDVKYQQICPYFNQSCRILHITMELYEKVFTLVVNRTKPYKMKIIRTYKSDKYIEVNAAGLSSNNIVFTGYINPRNKHEFEGVVQLNDEEKIYIKNPQKGFFNYFDEISKTIIYNASEKIEYNCEIKLVIMPSYIKSVLKNYDYENFKSILNILHINFNILIENVNRIFKTSSSLNNRKFKIKDLFIDSSTYCDKSYRGMDIHHSREEMCTNYDNEDKVLDSFIPHQNNKRYCLNIFMITDRSFESTLGYAYTRTFCIENSLMRTLFINVNFDNYLNDMRTFSLILVHEIAHVLGSPHDDENEDVHYIMYPSMHNLVPRLSQSSEARIKKSVDDFCTHEFKTNICRNGILDKTEECDCGNSKLCYCCNTLTCRLKDKAECSPFGKDGHCCNKSNCQFYSRKQNVKCKVSDSCNSPHYCYEKKSSKSGGCLPDKQINFTGQICDKNNFYVCNNGQCNKSICSLLSKKVCPSQNTSITNCSLHCFDESINKCVIIDQLVDKLNFLNKSKLLKSQYPLGSPCKRSGYFCSNNNLCQHVKHDISVDDDFPNYHDVIISALAHTLFALIIIVIICMLIFQIPYFFVKKNFLKLLYISLFDINLRQNEYYTSYFKITNTHFYLNENMDQSTKDSMRHELMIIIFYHTYNPMIVSQEIVYTVNCDYRTFQSMENIAFKN